MGPLRKDRNALGPDESLSILQENRGDSVDRVDHCPGTRSDSMVSSPDVGHFYQGADETICCLAMAHREERKLQ